jgi:predicted amidohydrolase YtcJ
LILTNGRVWTGDPQRPRVEAIVIEGNRIVAIGSSVEMAAPGMFADIAVLSDDLFSIAPEKIENVKVDYTIFDGRVIFQGR